ncbi:MAG: regulator of sirC expression with transglutaminase-like and TPR domain [Marinoscillum sp.]|jgi:regulator of sirC expression with transglutaminase-like and TPR domain
MINAVLESKKGNPISLCSVYLLVSRKLDLPIYGVNLPNLFILTYQGNNNHFYINVFNKGLIFSKDDIDNYLEQLDIPRNEEYYQPCSNTQIVVRSIRNLMMSFEKLGDYQRTDELKIALNRIGESPLGMEL